MRSSPLRNCHPEGVIFGGINKKDVAFGVVSNDLGAAAKSRPADHAFWSNVTTGYRSIDRHRPKAVFGELGKRTIRTPWVGHQVGIGRGCVGFGAVSFGGVLSKSIDLYVVGSGSITWESGIPGGICLENVAGVVICSEAGNSCGVGSEAVHFAVDNSKGEAFGSVISEAVDFEAISPGGATCESVTLEAAAVGVAKSAARWAQAWIDASSPPAPAGANYACVKSSNLPKYLSRSWA